MTKKTIVEDVSGRARDQYPERVRIAAAYLGANVKTYSRATELRHERIAEDPTASELLARGYGVGIADEVRRQE